MPETVRKYITEHGTIYTQKITTDKNGNISEVWMRGSEILKGGAYASSKNADKIGMYFDEHAKEKGSREEVYKFALGLIKKLKEVPYSKDNGKIISLGRIFYKSSVVEKGTPKSNGRLSDEHIEEILSPEDSAILDSGFSGKLEGLDSSVTDLNLADQNYEQTKRQQNYGQPKPEPYKPESLLSQIKQDPKGNFKQQTRPPQKKAGFLSKINPFKKKK